MKPVRLHRKHLGLTVAWCAKHTPNRNGGRGVCQRTWKGWESGQYNTPAIVIAWLKELADDATKAAQERIAGIEPREVPNACQWRVEYEVMQHCG